MPMGKGKAVAGKGSSGKRKQEDEDKTGRRKRTNPGVLQFFEDIADVDDFEGSESDIDLFDDDDVGADFLDELLNQEVPDVKSEPGKAHIFPVIPKEEELSDGELENMVQERYRDGSGFVTYAEDGYDTKGSSERHFFMPSSKDPVIWKVKCMVGRERHSAFCLMQKYVHLRSSLGTKLQIISAFSPEHLKGFIYIEADRQCDVTEACKGLSFIYNSRVAPVPRNEISHLFSVRNKNIEISVGMWARVKNGKYKGDLAQVVFVDETRKKATVKLIPRIDFQALAEKYVRTDIPGILLFVFLQVLAMIADLWEKPNRTATGRNFELCYVLLLELSLFGLVQYLEQALLHVLACPFFAVPVLLSVREFRPLIQCRRDRDTGEVFEVLDNLLLKDGFLYKKVSIDSLSFWGVQPSEAELQKFEPPKKDESDASEFLTQLYGEKIKKLPTLSDKRDGKGKMEKGECSCGPSSENEFELHDFVLVGRKDFGVIIGMEKDDRYKILKEGKDGPTIVTVEQHDLKNGPRDRRFIGLDKHKKIISVNDSVRIVEGPYEGKEGIVKQVYRGIVFLHDENELENSGYVCTKSQRCEKIKLSADGCKDKGESGPTGFGDSSSAPKSPSSPDKPWEATNDTREFNQGDKDSMFSVGQMLRIRVGPLKGYLCRVVAIRRSEITVKLDSKQKVLTVKSEHLSEVRGKSFTNYSSEDPGSSSIKPFDLLGTEGGSDRKILAFCETGLAALAYQTGTVGGMLEDRRQNGITSVAFGHVGEIFRLGIFFKNVLCIVEVCSDDYECLYTFEFHSYHASIFLNSLPVMALYLTVLPVELLFIYLC
ncbi:NGN domain [Dillenia turbinata]|uniref:NGN domain n=1 Tax=Dillenia turbinata TaxID=194707 RepID=A0AAN8ZAW1_9MAGN